MWYVTTFLDEDCTICRRYDDERKAKEMFDYAIANGYKAKIEKLF